MFRRRRLTFAVLAVGGLLAAGYAGVWWYVQSGGWAGVAAASRTLDRDDPGWRLDDLAADHNRAADDGPNGAAAILAAFQAAGGPPPRPDPDFYDELFAQPVSNRRPLAPLWRAVQFRARYAPAHAAALRAAALTRGGFPFHPTQPNPYATLLPFTQNCRAVANVLQVEAVVRAAGRRPGAVLPALRASLAAPRLIGAEPTLISQLCRMAMAQVAVSNVERALAWGAPLADAELAELQSGLAAELAFPRLTVGARGERALGMRAMEGLNARQLPPTAILPTKALPAGGAVSPALEFELLRAGLGNDAATLLDEYNRMVTASELPPGPARRAAMMADRPAALGPVGSALWPAWSKVAAAEDRVRARLGTAVAALGCERFRLRTGRWPEQLAEVPADLLPNPPADPYTGEALRGRRTADGFVVYAVGEDLADDGGRNLNLWTTPPKTPMDVGFRLWDADQRGLPAGPDAEPGP